MHHEPNFAYGEILAAATLPVAALWLAGADGRQGPAVDDPPRAGRGRRRDHAVELPERPGHARRRARRSRSATRSCSSPIRRRRSSAARCSRPSSARPGLPEGLLQIVVGGADVGEALVTDPNVSLVSFTGSTAVGRRVGELAGALLKKVSLELGGNNAFIVLDDADLDAAASAAGAFSAFQFQGQVCFAAGRHLVHETLADEYVEALRSKARRLRMGDPYREDVQLGPIVNEKQIAPGRRHRPPLDRGRGAARRGRHPRGPVLPADGAGRRHAGPARPGPTRSSARSRRSRPSRTDDEAVALANGSEYGLVGAVYSRSLSRGLAIANRIKAGMVHVNDGTLNDEATIPFGGMGESGNGGRYGGEANLDNFTEWQWVTVRDEPPTFPF